MNDTTINMRGYVGSDVVLREAGDVQVAEFRLGVTPRAYNRATDSWGDGVTQWYTVNAWRQRAINVKKSLNKGEPVMVVGRLTVREWADKDGVLRTTQEIEADYIGHDLLRGSSMFVRPPFASETGSGRDEADERDGREGRDAEAGAASVPEWAVGTTAA